MHVVPASHAHVYLENHPDIPTNGFYYTSWAVNKSNSTKIKFFV